VGHGAIRLDKGMIGQLIQDQQQFFMVRKAMVDFLLRMIPPGLVKGSGEAIRVIE
jgi:hypothetical protein